MPSTRTSRCSFLACLLVYTQVCCFVQVPVLYMSPSWGLQVRKPLADYCARGGDRCPAGTVRSMGSTCPLRGFRRLLLTRSGDPCQLLPHRDVDPLAILETGTTRGRCLVDARRRCKCFFLQKAYSLYSGLFETSAATSASLRAYSSEQCMEPAAVNTGAGL